MFQNWGQNAVNAFMCLALVSSDLNHFSIEN